MRALSVESHRQQPALFLACQRRAALFGAVACALGLLTSGAKAAETQPKAAVSITDVELLAERVAALEADRYQTLPVRQASVDPPVSLVTPGHGASTVQISGRIHTDVWGFVADSPGVNGFESGDVGVSPQDRLGFRRVRIGADGDLFENMLYKVELELAGGEESEFRDVYAGWKDLPFFQQLLVGNQKRPYGLDHINSSRFNVFLERPWIIEAFNQDNRRLGVQSWGVSDNLAWNWRYGVFNQRLIQDEGTYTSDHWQGQIAGRLAHTAWYDEESDGRNYLHLAISGTWADTDEDQLTENFAGSGINEARFSTRPEARTDSSWIDTGVIAGADSYTLAAIEGVLNLGPWQFVAEQQNVFMERVDAPRLTFHGGYAYVSYFLTGEHIPWDRHTGQLGRVEPFCDFIRTRDPRRRCGPGAWQIAARWSYADLADQDIRGGDAQSVTLACNWYWNPYAKLQTEYHYGYVSDNERNAVPGGPPYGSYQVVGARMVIDY